MCHVPWKDKSSVVITQLTEIQVQSKQSSEWFGHYNDCVAKVCEIDHEQRQGRQGGKQQLVSPPQIQHIISKSQKNHAADGQKRSNQLHELSKRNKDAESDFEIQRQVLNGGGKWYTDGQTSSWGKPLHWFPTKQLRKGTGMKQKRMMRKTVPLITPWDSGLQKVIQKHGEGKSTKRATIECVIAGDSHFLFGCFI